MKMKRIVSQILCILMLTSTFTFTASVKALPTEETADYYFYVSAEGLDTNAGTSTAPVKTIAQAAALANALSDKATSTVQINLLSDIEETLSSEGAGDFIGIGKLIINGNGKTLTIAYTDTDADDKEDRAASKNSWNNFCDTEYKNLKLTSNLYSVITYTGYDMSFDNDCEFFKTGSYGRINIGAVNMNHANYGLFNKTGGTINIDATGYIDNFFLSDFEIDGSTGESSHTSDDIYGEIIVNIGKNNDTEKKLSIGRFAAYYLPAAQDARHIYAKINLNVENTDITKFFATRADAGQSNTAQDVYLSGYAEYVIGNNATVEEFYIARDGNYSSSSSATSYATGTVVLIVNEGATITTLRAYPYVAGNDNLTHYIVNNGGTIPESFANGESANQIWLNVTRGTLTPYVSDKNADKTKFSPTFKGFYSDIENGTAKFYIQNDDNILYECPIVDGKILATNFEAGTYKVVLTASADSGVISESELPNTLYKLKTEKNLTVGYLGGSVTAGHGASDKEAYSWRALTKKWFETTFSDATITEVNDAIGGTGMFYGLHRAEKRYFNGKAPDINFIEMAVNDEYDLLMGADQYRYIESFIRKVYNSNPKAEIVFVITSNIDHFKEEIESDMPVFGQAYRDLAEYYNIPVIHVFRELAFDIYEENGNQIVESIDNEVWKKYYKDTVHPIDLGYAHYANTIIEYLKEQLPTDVAPTSSSYTEKKISNTPYCTANGRGELLLDATIVDPKDLGNQENISGFSVIDMTDAIPFNRLYSNTAGDSIILEFNSEKLFLWLSASPPQTLLTWTIDGVHTGEKTVIVQNAAIGELITKVEITKDLDLDPGKHIIEITHEDATAPIDIRYFLVSGLSGQQAKMSVLNTLPDETTIKVAPCDEEFGTATIGDKAEDTVLYGTQVTVSATANEGYAFKNWTEKDTGIVVSEDAEYTFYAGANKDLVANFVYVAKEYYVSKDGSDTTGDGSEEKPYASITKIAEVVNNLPNKEDAIVFLNLLTDITEIFPDANAGDFIGIGKLIINGNGKTLTLGYADTDADNSADRAAAKNSWNNFCDTEYKNLKLTANMYSVVTYTGYDMSFDKDCNIFKTGNYGYINIAAVDMNNANYASYFDKTGGTINIDATGYIDNFFLSDFQYNGNMGDTTHTSDDIFGEIIVNIGKNNDTEKKLSIGRFAAYYLPAKPDARHIYAKINLNVENTDIESFFATRADVGNSNTAQDVYLSGYAEYVIGNNATVEEFYIARDGNYSSSSSATGTVVLVVNSGGTVSTVKSSSYTPGSDNLSHYIINNGGTITEITATAGQKVLNVTGGTLTPYVTFNATAEGTKYNDHANNNNKVTGFKTDVTRGTVTFKEDDDPISTKDFSDKKIALPAELVAGSTYNVIIAPAKVNITFNPNGGSGDETAVEYGINSKISSKAYPEFLRDNVSPVGFATESGATTTSDSFIPIENFGDIEVLEEKTYYAIWPEPYKVIFYDEDGTTVLTQFNDYNGSFTYQPEDRPGLDLEGWYINDSDVLTPHDGVFEIDGDTTFVAKYTVTDVATYVLDGKYTPAKDEYEVKLYFVGDDDVAKLSFGYQWNTSDMTLVSVAEANNAEKIVIHNGETETGKAGYSATYTMAPIDATEEKVLIATFTFTMDATQRVSFETNSKHFEQFIDDGTSADLYDSVNEQYKCFYATAGTTPANIVNTEVYETVDDRKYIKDFYVSITFIGKAGATQAGKEAKISYEVKDGTDVITEDNSWNYNNNWEVSVKLPEYTAVEGEELKIKVEKPGYLSDEVVFNVLEINSIIELTAQAGDIKGSATDTYGDGVIDFDDYLRVVNAFTTETVIDDAYRNAVDINEDGTVDADDIALIYNYIKNN